MWVTNQLLVPNALRSMKQTKNKTMEVNGDQKLFGFGYPYFFK